MWGLFNNLDVGYTNHFNKMKYSSLTSSAILAMIIGVKGIQARVALVQPRKFTSA